MAGVLGQTVAAPRDYSPAILERIDRSSGRRAIGGNLPEFHGSDVWHLYELSWLNAQGQPEQYVGVLTIPAASPATVESKSLKLYLNSLNFHVFASAEAAREQIIEDVSKVVGGRVGLVLLRPTDIASITREPGGVLIDGAAVSVPVAEEPNRHMLSVGAGEVERTLVSHRLRSLCPVTGQPDWATLMLRWKGVDLHTESLLTYIDSFREHQEFHEQCVERIFIDLCAVLQPERLVIAAFYQRRGGIDITPWRSLQSLIAPSDRMGRQ